MPALFIFHLYFYCNVNVSRALKTQLATFPHLCLSEDALRSLNIFFVNVD